MTTVTFDTLELVQELKHAGIPQEQAEAVVRIIAKSQDQLATKTDIQHLEFKIDAKFNLIQWMLGVVIALAVANFAKQFF